MEEHQEPSYRRCGVTSATPPVFTLKLPNECDQPASNASEEGPKKVQSRIRYVLIGLFCFVGGIIAGHISGMFLTMYGPDNWKSEKISDSSNFCPIKSATVEQPWENPTLFSPLSPKEMNTVAEHMLKEGFVDEYNGNVTRSYMQMNYLIRVFLLQPSKASALAYLDSGGPFPGRYAEVHVIRGNRTEKKIHVQEYKVGPIASPEKMTVEKLGPPIDFDRRQLDHKEAVVLVKLIDKSFKKMNHLFRISFDGAQYPADIWPIKEPLTTPRVFDRQSACFLVLRTSLVTSDPLPVSARIFHGGNDFSVWYLYDFYYNNQGPFPTADSLMDEFDEGKLKLIVLPKGYKKKIQRRSNIQPRDSNSYRPRSNLVPPRTYEPDGPRYLIRGHRVEWMGWSFELSTNQIRGPGLFDVKFKGERIAYEISLNDISLLYSSSTTGAGFTSGTYVDTVYNLGESFKIYKGIDCPEHTSVIPTTFFEDDGVHPTVVDAFCVFEADGQEMLWRHEGKEESGGMRDNFLIVRAPLTLGNYDYTTEFHFKLDGKLHTLITSSGLLFTAYWDNRDPLISKDTSRTPFGYRVSTKTLGSIHDHTFAFKVDLDIVDRENRFELIHWKTSDISDIFKSNNVNMSENQRKRFAFQILRYLDYELLRNETALKLNSNDPAIWTVLSSKHTNNLGTKRGYRILPTSMEWNEVMPVTHPMMIGMSHMKSSCAITKQRDSERYISFSQYDVSTFNKPLKTLDHYLNSENIVDEDVVNWLSVRFLHVPTAEDFPVTTRVQRGFSLIPFNFFDMTPTFDMPQMSKRNNTIYTPYSVPKCFEKIQSSENEDLTYVTGYGT